MSTVREQTHNKSPKPTLESVAALLGYSGGGAAWLKRYTRHGLVES